MKTITMEPWSIKEHPDNPRKRLKRGSKAYEGIKDILTEFGLVTTLVWNKRSVKQGWPKGEEGVLLGGHQRLNVIRDLAWDEVTLTEVDVDEEGERVLMIGLNKHGGEWDNKKLGEELAKLEASRREISLTGFSGAELDKLRAESKFSDPEIEFTEELLEEMNYVTLYFTNTVDWQSAKDVLKLRTVHALDSKKGYERKGIGRVLPGAPIIKRLLK